MASDSKQFGLSPEIMTYISAHSRPLDEVQQWLVDETTKLGGISVMQISTEQGTFMTMLARLMGARRAIEVGTFTGYSALCMARGLSQGGQLVCCDVSEKWTDTAREAWKRAGVDHLIDLRIGNAANTLAALDDGPFDLAFIDADKTGYLSYYHQILPRLRAGGVILVDNTLWFARVISETDDSADTVALREFNDYVINDSSVESVMLPIADGLTMIVKH